MSGIQLLYNELVGLKDGPARVEVFSARDELWSEAGGVIFEAIAEVACWVFTWTRVAGLGVIAFPAVAVVCPVESNLRRTSVGRPNWYGD